MDFRRIPFQFSTTDPLKRQEELQRRFGLPVNKSDMYVDFANPGAVGARSDNSSASNSPRLQHRVPIFVEGQSDSTKPSGDAQNVDSGPKPNVRVIPIEIEGEDNTTKRHRWLSGTSGPIKERFNGSSIPVENVEHSTPDWSPKAPRVCNIPIKIEGKDHGLLPKSPVKTQKVKMPESPKHTGVKLNGCSTSKLVKINEKNSKANDKPSPEEVILQKIWNVEEKLKGYHADVEKFSGTNKEKQYRYLDEMLTRCMLELDEIDTMGLDSIRLARKAAVKKVQASIDLLESKIIKEEKQQDQNLKEPMEIESSTIQPSENTKEADTKIKEAETEETKKSVETDPNEANMDNQLSIELGSASVEVTDVLPEQINEKVENISIMEMEAVLNPDQKESVCDNSANKTNVTLEEMNVDILEPVQITEVEADANATVTSDIEPVIEEPFSDSKDEDAVDMDLDSCNYENDLKFDEFPSIQVCEVENDAVLNPNKLEAETNRQLDQNSETEIKTSDIPLATEQTVLSNDNIEESSNADESLIVKQPILSSDNIEMFNADEYSTIGQSAICIDSANT